jgi:hypothetical protein
MTLTVRLEPALANALDRHCADLGLTKSAVVHASLAAFLARAGSTGPARLEGADGGSPTSANYRAFVDAGLLGALRAGRESATKAVVRQRASRARRA